MVAVPQTEREHAVTASVTGEAAAPPSVIRSRRCRRLRQCDQDQGLPAQTHLLCVQKSRSITDERFYNVARAKCADKHCKHA